ncbi:hypothetical protein [Actinophytocola glycyrrhizae]|uniref:Uncharacterized protein n=1 Tax=Actinophytocola glycyrrhizae TaxID=2044873 RepID=A0ABV9S8K7_9PSEU
METTEDQTFAAPAVLAALAGTEYRATLGSIDYEPSEGVRVAEETTAWLRCVPATPTSTAARARSARSTRASRHARPPRFRRAVAMALTVTLPGTPEAAAGQNRPELQDATQAFVDIGSPGCVISTARAR